MRILCALAIIASSAVAQDAEKFYASIRANDLAGLKGLLDQGANTNTVDNRQITPLMYAAEIGSTQFSAFLPGVSTALNVAVEHGMRIAFPMVLVSERDFGDWTRYLPKNPGLM